jgi:hypothetical protein
VVDREAPPQFDREAMAAARLHHTHNVPVLEVRRVERAIDTGIEVAPPLVEPGLGTARGRADPLDRTAGEAESTGALARRIRRSRVTPWCGHRWLPRAVARSRTSVARGGGDAPDGDTTAGVHDDVVAVNSPASRRCGGDKAPTRHVGGSL